MSVEVTPNLLILGAARSGTTSLYSWLAGHPDVCMSRPKEPPFFDDKAYYQGMDEFAKKYLAHWRGERIVGEARVTKLHLPFVAQRVRKVVPEAKLVVSLRDPGERAYSHWRKHRVQGVMDESFEASIDRNLKSLGECSELVGERGAVRFEERRVGWRQGREAYPVDYLEQGHYAEHVGRYMDLFGRDRLLVVDFGEIRERPRDALNRVCRFVGVKEVEGKVHLRAANRLGDRGMAGLGGWAGETWRRLGGGLRAGGGGLPSAEMALDVREWLRDYYARWNQRLEGLLGREIWW